MVRSVDGLTGEEIADIAYAQHSIQPSGLGAVCEVLIYVFSVICTVVVGLRVYVRAFKVQNDVKWRLNDYLAVVGFLPYIPASVLGALCVHYGIGATDAHLDTYEMRNFITVRGMEYLILYELIYYASSTITKFAIAVTILYICVERQYKYIMYSIMCIMAITAAICVVWFFVNCIPFQGYWNPGIGNCKSADGFLNLSYVGTAAQVASDWACAITPFFVVYSLQMTRRSKIAVVAILGLGVLASIAALMRIISYQYIDSRKYPENHYGTLSTVNQLKPR
ncbi:integral membrane [Fusarium longipes]|uniref:Integral membrane n=1 Tax=Fusarium longipes TaxID=694270 RepID=A0A395SIS1_9HYPO|nr:integral membrane [Fusarium longipes]